MKLIAVIVGAILVFVGISIGVFGASPGDSTTPIVGIVVAVGGVYLIDWGLGITRRWRAWRAKRDAPKYTPRGGGM